MGDAQDVAWGDVNVSSAAGGRGAGPFDARTGADGSASRYPGTGRGNASDDAPADATP